MSIRRDFPSLNGATKDPGLRGFARWTLKSSDHRKRFLQGIALAVTDTRSRRRSRQTRESPWFFQAGPRMMSIGRRALERKRDH
jgi:hypothetical protein